MHTAMFQGKMHI
ncbi:hypothetical protein JL09_g6962 [Pichia kudriavzevii]|uniref:Uncharacterized protein n=1 Tax=Pichia kudriavzevii TaxID=4909 RepID=A0A099NKI2_PICKU|nr:hypothetical protein JL09_g6962 [Pichia kudriavzevii]